MTQTRLKPLDQRLVYSGISWQEFKSIETGFVNAPGIRLSYYQGEVEILGVSQDHEFFSRTISAREHLSFAKSIFFMIVRA